MKIIPVLAGLLLAVRGISQIPFALEIKQLPFPGIPAIHSGAYAEYNGKWLLIGGRNNGLHGFLPPFAFPSDGINDSIYVVDPYAGQVWKSAVAGLPVQIRESIAASNIPNWQEDTVLYLAGGYGWQTASNDFVTFPTLTAVPVPQLIDSVISSSGFSSLFRQTADSMLMVTGGQLRKIDSVYHLVFGHDFQGTYDKDDTTGYFVQNYTYAIRKFKINDDGVSLSVVKTGEVIDSINFRRRDLNVVPQIFPDGTRGFTAFSGVFQPIENLPWLSSIDISASGIVHMDTFQQKFSHYESAAIPLYDSVDNYMHTIFPGGISRYSIDSATGGIVDDTLVPFVRTISRVTRAPDSSLAESVYPFRMPAFLGSNSIFFSDTSVKKFENGVIDLCSLSGKKRVGFIFGGIETPDSNISATDPALSWASTRFFEVWIDMNPVSSHPWINPHNAISAAIFPNPGMDMLNVEIHSAIEDDGKILLIDNTGKEHILAVDVKIVRGTVRHQIPLPDLSAGAYRLRIQGTFSSWNGSFLLR